MNISELRTPIRIYWDLPPASGAGADFDCLAVAEQIVSLKILNLDLTASVSTPGPLYLALLERFATVPMAVSLTIPLPAANAELMAPVGRYRLRNIHMGISSSEELSAAALVLTTVAGVKQGISFMVTAENYHQLPEVLSFCITHGLMLVLPMQRLETGGDFLVLSRHERQELSDRLNAVGATNVSQVVIHDPFLWRAFFPALGFPDGRCQAANTMLSITATGDVYPCPSLPVKLGNVAEMSLTSIAGSAEKKSLREKLVRTPLGCDACIELEGCYGGCRGRGYCATGSWEEPDPGCL